MSVIGPVQSYNNNTVLYNGLACHVEYSIFAQEWYVGIGVDLPAWTACWPTAVVAVTVAAGLP